jgi:hypothetical protein
MIIERRYEMEKNKVSKNVVNQWKKDVQNYSYSQFDKVVVSVVNGNGYNKEWIDVVVDEVRRRAYHKNNVVVN